MLSLSTLKNSIFSSLSGQTISLFDAAFFIFNNDCINSSEEPNKTKLEIQNIQSQQTKTKEKDPWSLDLFEDVKTTTNDSILSNPQKPAVTKLIKEPKIVRSLSQPHVNTNQCFALFNLRQRAEQKRPEVLENKQYPSDFYLYSLVWACVIMLFWKNLMLLPILPVSILIYFIKHVGSYLGIWNILQGYYIVLREHLVHWCSQRIDAIAPIPIRGLYRIMQTINTSLKNSIKDSIDTVSSCVVIFALLIFVICASIFFVFQVK